MICNTNDERNDGTIQLLDPGIPCKFSLRMTRYNVWKIWKL